jgi:hypothetical protein
MTEQMHPMLPTNTLLNNWESDWLNERENFDMLLIQAYQAGADAELDACCEWLVAEPWFKYEHEAVEDLRAARRPKPKSLKEQALIALDDAGLDAAHENILRRALEALPDD